MSKIKISIMLLISAGLFMITAIIITAPEAVPADSTLISTESKIKISTPAEPTTGGIETPIKKETQDVAVKRVLTINNSENNTVSQAQAQADYTPAPVSTPALETEVVVEEVTVDYINSESDNSNNWSEDQLEYIRGEMDWVKSPCPISNLECGMPSNFGSDHNQNINSYSL